MSARLAPALLAAALLGATPALAQSEPVPTPPLVGDGATPATLQILAPAGTRVKVVPDRGEVRAVTPIAGGHLITYVPPVVGEKTQVGLTVRVRGGGIRQDLRLNPVVVPSWAGTFSITMDPKAVKAGESATVRVRPSSPGPLGGTRDLRIVASEGTIGDLVPSGDGAWVARYTAPRGSDPSRPVLAVVDAAAPTSFFDAEVVPVQVRRSITLDAPADTMNVLRVGSTEYGPNKASPSGKVSFEVDLHPDVREGMLTTSRGSEVTSNTVPLPVDIPASLVVAPLPSKAGGGTTLPVPIACRQGPGTPCDPRDVKIEVSAGSVGDAMARGEMLIVPWTLPDTGTPSLTASVGEVSASARLTMVPSPNTLTLSSDPPALSDATTTAELTARAKDPAGKGVIGRLPAFAVRNGRQVRAPRDNKDGTYTGSWRLEGDETWLEALAWPKLSGTGLAAQRLVAFPVVSSVNADGATELSLVVVAEDAVGMPVPGVDLELAVPVGDGAVPPTAQTDRNGVAVITYKVGVQAGLAQIDVSGAGLTTTTSLWQTGATAPPPALQAVGSAPDIEAVERWRSRVASLFVTKAAAPVVAAAPVTNPGADVPTTPGVAAPAVTPGTPATPPDAGGTNKPAGPTNTGYALLRARGAISNSPFTYASTLVGEGADRYAPQANIALANTLAANVGAQGDAEVWVLGSRALGFDVRARVGVYRLAMGPEKSADVPWSIEGGVRYRAWDTGTWSAYAGAGFARTSEVVFVYADETRTSADILTYDLMGLRAGGGIRGEWGPGMFEVDAQTVWGAGPNVGRLELRGDIPVADPLLITVAAGAEGRMSAYKPDDGSDVKVRVRRGTLDVRVGIAVAAF